MYQAVIGISKDELLHTLAHPHLSQPSMHDSKWLDGISTLMGKDDSCCIVVDMKLSSWFLTVYNMVVKHCV